MLQKQFRPWARASACLSSPPSLASSPLTGLSPAHQGGLVLSTDCQGRSLAIRPQEQDGCDPPEEGDFGRKDEISVIVGLKS